MANRLLALIVEDSPEDAGLLLRMLRKGGYATEHVRVETEEEYRQALAEREWDIVLADYALPSFSGMRALEILAESDLDLPLILVSGTVGEDTAVNAMKAGAADYILKDNLIRLVPAVERSVRDAAGRKARRQVERSLRDRDARLASIFGAAPIGIGVVVNRVFTEVNDTLCEMIGYTREELIGKSSRMLYPTQKDYDYVGKEKYAQITNLGKGTVETRFQHKDGRIIDVLLSSAPLDPGNMEQGVTFTVMDITERRRAEEALRQSEAKYRNLYETESDAIFLIDKESGKILEVNRAAVETYGYSEEELLSMRNVDVSAEPDATRQATVSGSHKVLVRWHRKKDGTVFPVEIVASYFEWQGRTVQIAAIRDITERIKAEEELRAREKQVDAFFTNSLDLLAIANTDGYFLRLNPEWEKTLGYSIAELEGTRFMDLVHPEDIAATILAVEQLSAQKSVMGFINRSRRKDGEYRWLEWRSTPVGEFIYAAARDITEKMRDEAQLRLQSAALQAAANAIMITNREGVIEWVNPAFEALTGYTAAEAFGKTPRLLKSDRHDQAFYQQLWDTILAGEPWQGVIINRRKDGSLYTEETTITPLKDVTGEITRFIAIKQDITERERLTQVNEQITVFNDALRRANTVSEVTGAALEYIQAHLPLLGTAILLPDNHSDTFITVNATGAFRQFRQAVLDTNKGITGMVQRTGKPYFSPHLQADPNYIPQVNVPSNLVAGGCIPLVSQGAAVGFLWVGSEQPLEKDQEQLLIRLAEIAGEALKRATLYDQTERRLALLSSLRSIDMAITASLDLRIMLRVLLDQAVAQLGVDAADVLLLNPVNQTLEFVSGRGFQSNIYETIRLDMGDSLPGEVIRQRGVMAVANIAPMISRYRRVKHLVGEGLTAYYGIPLVAKGKIRGVLEFFSKQPRHTDTDWMEYIQTVAIQGAMAIENSELFQSIQHTNLELTMSIDATIEAWSRVLEMAGVEDAGHGRRVVGLAIRLARQLHYPESQMANLRQGVLLHDIGKLIIPDTIIHKAGELTEEEQSIMQQHPVYAYQLLTPVPYLHGALDVAHYHHENWDGTGYPSGLQGNQIPLSARIVAVVDAYDAMRADKPYRKGFSRGERIAYLREQAGKKFDPMIVAAFLEVVEVEPD